MHLTEDDKRFLALLEGKLSHMRDLVRGVAMGFHPGLVLWGAGGTSKSYTILKELQRLNVKYVYHNSRMTARGLVDALQRSPDDVHFIEDAETLLDDKKSWGVLRSALWSQSNKRPLEREITWRAHQAEIRFTFTGGIIIVGNSNFAESIPEIRAIKSRIQVSGVHVSNNEIKALMKQICQEGYTYGDDYMTPDECWTVGSFIIDKMGALQRNLDLRLLINGFRDYLQSKTGNATNHWEVLLEGRMQERIVYKGRSGQKADETHLALEIMAMNISNKEKFALWREKTGLAQAAFYRALQRSGKR